MAKKMTQEKGKLIKIFANRLQSLMKGKGTNQQELAKVLEVTPQAVSLYVTGKTGADITVIHKCALFFNVSSDYLLGLSEKPSPHNKIDAIDVSVYTGLRLDTVLNLLSAKKVETTQEAFDSISDIINNSLALCGGYYTNAISKKSRLLTFESKEE